MHLPTPRTGADVGPLHRGQAAAACWVADDKLLLAFAAICGGDLRHRRGDNLRHHCIAALLLDAHPQHVSFFLGGARAKGLTITTAKQAEYFFRAIRAKGISRKVVIAHLDMDDTAVFVVDQDLIVRFSCGHLLDRYDLPPELLEGWSVARVARLLGSHSMSVAVEAALRSGDNEQRATFDDLFTVQVVAEGGLATVLLSTR